MVHAKKKLLEINWFAAETLLNWPFAPFHRHLSRSIKPHRSIRKTVCRVQNDLFPYFSSFIVPKRVKPRNIGAFVRRITQRKAFSERRSPWIASRLRRRSLFRSQITEFTYFWRGARAALSISLSRHVCLLQPWLDGEWWMRISCMAISWVKEKIRSNESKIDYKRDGVCGCSPKTSGKPRVDSIISLN